MIRVIKTAVQYRSLSFTSFAVFEPDSIAFSGLQPCGNQGGYFSKLLFFLQGQIGTVGVTGVCVPWKGFKYEDGTVAKVPV